MITKFNLKNASKFRKSIIFFLLIVITTSSPCLLYSQIKLSYSIGGIGNFITKTASTNTANTSTYSNPLILTGSKCYTISNGLVKFMPVSIGQFFTTCDVNLDYIKLSISVFPNPATTYTTIKFLNQIQIEDKFRVQVYSSGGDLLSGIEVSQKQLLAGYRLALNSLNAGLYYIQISSNTVLQSYKILKV